MTIRVRPLNREVDVLSIDFGGENMTVVVRYKDTGAEEEIDLGYVIADGALPEILRNTKAITE